MVKYRLYNYKKKRSGKRTGYETFNSRQKAKEVAKRYRTLYGWRTQIKKIKG